MIVKVVEVVGMFGIESRNRKCEKMSTISRMISVGAGAEKFCSDDCRKACNNMSLYEVGVRIFG